MLRLNEQQAFLQQSPRAAAFHPAVGQERNAKKKDPGNLPAETQATA